jgi:hypothetical protein
MKPHQTLILIDAGALVLFAAEHFGSLEYPENIDIYRKLRPVQRGSG